MPSFYPQYQYPQYYPPQEMQGEIQRLIKKLDNM